MGIKSKSLTTGVVILLVMNLIILSVAANFIEIPKYSPSFTEDRWEIPEEVSKDVPKKSKPIEPEEEQESDIIIDEIVYPVPYVYIDYNSDGILDLVRDERDRTVYVYINSGTDKNPVYTKGIIFERESSIIDELNQIKQDQEAQRSKPRLATETQTWVELNYYRFDVFIETDFYYNNQENLTDFFNKFEPRFDLLENTTQWSSEDAAGTKLRIEVTGNPLVCVGGAATSGIIYLTITNPPYHPGCVKPQIIEGEYYWGSEKDLGEFWADTGTAIHEATHAINPNPILFRRWLTEGFAKYYEYNILTSYGDINQETSDYYIHQGDSGYNWEGYVENDYHDTTINNKEIQKSLGYSITSWMLSMLRDNYSLDWNSFYTIMKNNQETLDYTKDTWGDSNNYYTDMVIIDMFGRALGMDFETGIKPIFRYDGPSGPGWGVRQWVPTDWYADLYPEISVSSSMALPGETINVEITVYNNGWVDLQNVPIRAYATNALTGENLMIYENNELISNNSEIVFPFQITSEEEAYYTIYVFVDENNIKMESNENNNRAIKRISFEEPSCFLVKVEGTKDEYKEVCETDLNPWS